VQVDTLLIGIIFQRASELLPGARFAWPPVGLVMHAGDDHQSVAAL